eukprot:774940-Rhodomonas_salina.1
MTQLAVLDVSHNQIADELPAVASLLDGLGKLLVVCLRHNPVMRTPAQKRSLLAHMTRVWDGSELLRCVDSEITLQDRVAARQAFVMRGARKGASGVEDAGRLRADAALALCCRDVDRVDGRASAQELQLSNLGLGKWIVQSEALACFEGLKVLALRRNNLTELGVLCDAAVLPSLQVLDVRENQLADITSIAQAVLSHAQLRELGVEDNRCVLASTVCDRQYEDARARLVGLLVHDRLGLPGCELRYIDDRAVEVEEVVLSWGKCSRDPEVFRFEQSVVCQLRRQVEERQIEDGMVACEASELTLCARGLRFLDCCLFSNLASLDLSNNLLTADAIRASGLHLLRRIERVDVSSNNIADPLPVAQIVRAGH